MTLPIPSNVFADGELTNELSWYTRIFSAINTMYGTLSALPAIQHGNFSIAFVSVAALAGTATFPQGFASVPDVTVSCAPVGGNQQTVVDITGITTTQFTWRATQPTALTGTVTGYYIAAAG
jgi:hypothetical protein